MVVEPTSPVAPVDEGFGAHAAAERARLTHGPPSTRTASCAIERSVLLRCGRGRPRAHRSKGPRHASLLTLSVLPCRNARAHAPRLAACGASTGHQRSPRLVRRRRCSRVRLDGRSSGLCLRRTSAHRTKGSWPRPVPRPVVDHRAIRQSGATREWERQSARERSLWPTRRALRPLRTR